MNDVPEMKAVAWVPRAHADSELTVVGQFAWDDLREYPFAVRNPAAWECVPLYAGAEMREGSSPKGERPPGPNAEHAEPGPLADAPKEETEHAEERQEGVPAEAQAVIDAARQWWCERSPQNWDDAELAKAVIRLDGDWPGCPGCDFECGEPRVPATVDEQIHAVDCAIAQLVHEGKLHAPEVYAPPDGWTPQAARKEKTCLTCLATALGATHPTPAQEAPQAEPVAWQLRIDDSSQWVNCTLGTAPTQDKPCAFEWRYTYAAPQATAGVAPEVSVDRVLGLADVHADESTEDGKRIFDRGGLVAFAQDLLRVANDERDDGAGVAPTLTDEQIEALWVEHGLDECDPVGFARIILAAATRAEPAAKPVALDERAATLRVALESIVECHEVESGWVSDAHISVARAAIAESTLPFVPFSSGQCFNCGLPPSPNCACPNGRAAKARAEPAALPLAEPTPEMLDAFQRGFQEQLQIRHRARHKPNPTEREQMSAEKAGLLAMLEVARAEPAGGRDERAEFEAWGKREGVDVTLWLERPEHGYLNGRTCDYWTGWQARASLAAPSSQRPKDVGVPAGAVALSVAGSSDRSRDVPTSEASRDL